jgi:hypothetical protein
VRVNERAVLLSCRLGALRELESPKASPALAALKSSIHSGVGTVFFRNFTLSAQWGRLKANGGVLRAADGSTLSVPVTGPIEGTTLQGDGWSATLNSGWVVRPAARSGSFAIVREN